MVATKREYLLICGILLSFVLLYPVFSLALSDEEIQMVQSSLEGKTTGEKIAFWTERFVGTPYDKDPRGEYVTRAAIVADERVDCMYLTFRAVELSLSRTPEEAVQIALDKRFHSRGILKDGKVANYEDRFEYGEDMIQSGKWGKEISAEVGRMIRIRGSRGQEFIEVLPAAEIKKGIGRLRSGDLIFFIKAPEKRVAEEGVGHIGIVKIEGNGAHKKYYLIHASGTKTKGGVVKKVLLRNYLAKMHFIGAKVARFD
jgi:hypothetical protein